MSSIDDCKVIAVHRKLTLSLTVTYLEPWLKLQPSPTVVVALFLTTGAKTNYIKLDLIVCSFDVSRSCIRNSDSMVNHLQRVNVEYMNHLLNLPDVPLES